MISFRNNIEFDNLTFTNISHIISDSEYFYFPCNESNNLEIKNIIIKNEFDYY